MTKSQVMLISMSILAVAAALLLQGNHMVVVVFGWILLVISVIAGALSFLSVIAERPAWERWAEDEGRYCEECGVELTDDETECPECGARVGEEDEDEEDEDDEEEDRDEKGEDEGEEDEDKDGGSTPPEFPRKRK